MSLFLSESNQGSILNHVPPFFLPIAIKPNFSSANDLPTPNHVPRVPLLKIYSSRKWLNPDFVSFVGFRRLWRNTRRIERIKSRTLTKKNVLGKLYVKTYEIFIN